MCRFEDTDLKAKSCALKVKAPHRPVMEKGDGRGGGYTLLLHQSADNHQAHGEHEGEEEVESHSWPCCCPLALERGSELSTGWEEKRARQQESKNQR